MKPAVLLLAIFAIAPCTYAADTSRLAFVSEYIRELSAQADLERQGVANAKDTNTSTQMMGTVRIATTTTLELGTNIGMLKSMTFAPPFETLLPSLITVYERKIEIHKELKQIASALISLTPQPGVDYGKMAARSSELRAYMEYLGKTQFEITPLVCALLIDMKADSKGHASHLVITNAERRDLLEALKSDFGATMEAKEQSYVVSSAAVLRDFLHKGFKGADDSW